MPGRVRLCGVHNRGVHAQVSTVGMAQSTWLPGVRVPDVNVGSVAEAAGMRRGDIIARLDGQDVLPAPTAVQAVIQAIQ